MLYMIFQYGWESILIQRIIIEAILLSLLYRKLYIFIKDDCLHLDAELLKIIFLLILDCIWLI